MTDPAMEVALFAARQALEASGVVLTVSGEPQVTYMAGGAWSIRAVCGTGRKRREFFGAGESPLEALSAFVLDVADRRGA